MARVEVTVRGAGVFGLSVAWACARRGARVRVIDTAGIGAGSSGGLVGALSPHVPEQWNEKKAFQLESLLMAAEWWGAVEAASGLGTGFGRVGRLQALPDAAAVEMARARAAGAVALWQGRALWEVRAVTGAAWEPVSPSGFVVWDTLSARLHPRLAAAALVGAIRARGGEVMVGAAADEGAVVWATGVAGLNALSADLGRNMGGGVKGQAISVAYDAPQGAQLYAGGLHLVAHADGTVAIGSTSENQWAHEGVDGLVEDLLARAVAVCPALAGAKVLERWAGIRPRARSRAPLLGAWPGRPGWFVANGGFKIGFGMAPKVAEVMADLVLEAKDAVPEGFRVG